MQIKNPQHSLVFHFLLSAFMLAVLAACSSTGWSPVSEESAPSSAESAFARGNYDTAAAIWQKDALQAEPRKAASLRVRAMDAWMLAGDAGQARTLLSWVDRAELGTQDQARLDLVLADFALLQNRPDEAEHLLEQARSSLPSSSRSRYETLRARLNAQLSSPASLEISRAAQLAENIRFYDARSAVELMRTLENVSSGELEIRSRNPLTEREFAGWLDLAWVIRNRLVIPEGISADVSAWKRRHPEHLLTEKQGLETWLNYRQLFSPPRKVAVLLPGQGRLQAAGKAVRDGIMSAFMDNPGGAEILFFPTDDETQSAIAAYFNALDAGVDWIIGPLRKESVEAMLGLAGMATPVLALNELPTHYVAPNYLAGQVTGISLSQENEASRAAAHAAASGFERAIVIAPESSWGERMAHAFESEFLRDGRQILVSLRYLDTQNDHGTMLQRALKIDESNARAQKLENTLRVELEFEPSRRNDVDVIFMAANASQSRLLRPQLKFHDAGDIPVYATGRVYNGVPDPARNQDLNGILFPATPWQLSHTEKDEIPNFDSIRGGALGSLFTVGRDAWNILPWLDLINKDPGFSFGGESGTYRSGNAATLHRDPAWAMFKRGRPTRAPAPAPSLSNHESVIPAR